MAHAVSDKKTSILLAFTESAKLSSAVRSMFVNTA